MPQSRNQLWSQLATFVEPEARPDAPELQPGLVINQPEDPYEREAEPLLRMPELEGARGSIDAQHSRLPKMQRMCSVCNEERV